MAQPRGVSAGSPRPSAMICWMDGSCAVRVMSEPARCSSSGQVRHAVRRPELTRSWCFRFASLGFFFAVLVRRGGRFGRLPGGSSGHPAARICGLGLPGVSGIQEIWFGWSGAQRREGLWLFVFGAGLPWACLRWSLSRRLFRILSFTLALFFFMVLPCPLRRGLHWLAGSGAAFGRRCGLGGGLLLSLSLRLRLGHMFPLRVRGCRRCFFFLP